MLNEQSSPGGMASKRVAIYPRYSCDMSRPASMEDQERNCRKEASEKGWIVLDEYVRGDEAKTGRTMQNRPALDFLLSEAAKTPRPFDILMTDEQSRLSRKLKDILEIAEVLKHYGVKLYIVAQKLDSDDPNFPTLLTLHGMIDEQNSERMRHRVRRGQEGRIRSGFTSGSRCFGYRSVAVPNPDRPDLQGRAGNLGHEFEVIESQAATIRRICHLYADGLSDYEICLKLNQERVPAARKPRIGPDHTVWNTNLIKRILKNEKYIGKLVWNKTSQVIHPKTGKTVTRKNPPELWVHTDAPKLRIVSDELWKRVQDRLQIVNEKMTRRRIAGLNRAKKRDYLFSGLLYCGKCGSPISIGSSNKGRSATYGCVSWRYKRGCTNSLWIREDRLKAQLVNALATNLLVPEVMEYLITAVSRDLDAYLKGACKDQESSYAELKAREASLNLDIDYLVEEMLKRRSANSTALPEKLAKLEAERDRLQNDLHLLSAPKNLEEANHDLGAMVRANVANLLEVIREDVPKARQVLQRHIKKLILFPTLSTDGPAYEVLGEIDLFRPPSHRHERVLLARSSTGTVQQYTGHVDFLYRFAGLLLHPQVDLEPNPMLAPLASVLEDNPDLLHEPKTAAAWAALLKMVIFQDSPMHERMNADYVSWNFRHRADLFRERFGMVDFQVGRSRYYLFSTSPVLGASGVNPGACLTVV